MLGSQLDVGFSVVLGFRLDVRFSVGCLIFGWMLDVGCWMLDVGCWVLGVWCWVFGVAFNFDLEIRWPRLSILSFKRRAEVCLKSAHTTITPLESCYPFLCSQHRDSAF